MPNQKDRKCYAKGEANLNYQHYSSGYRYSLDNCIIDNLIGNIIWNCRCIPNIASSEAKECFSNMELKFCKGEGLNCANAEMDSIHDGNLGKNDSELVLEDIENLNRIGNLSKPLPIKCLPNCQVQDNVKEMSSALYPQKHNFFYHGRFCHVASHILQVTCNNENRTYFLDMKYPDLCATLQYFDDYFGYASSCQKWPGNYLETNGWPNTSLIEQMVQYGRDNLALVRVIMQSPYATKIKRDLAMTMTDYIANTGGLLGLCLGFSFISGIEILFFLGCCCKEFKRKL